MENRVGFWPRALAFLLDGLVLSAIGFVLQRPLAAVFPNALAAVIQEVTSRPTELGESADLLEKTARYAFATAIVSPFYWLVEAFGGFSPAKLMLGLRIVSEEGKKAPLLSLVIRYGIKNAASIVAVIALFSAWPGLDALSRAMYWATAVGFFLVLSPARMAMHDRIAGTAVLRKVDVVVTAAPTGSATSSS
jgi:uncharacterized RDD family membrane protein YckC